MSGIDSYTKLLLHCDGADESTDFPDDSGNSHDGTAVGTAQVDTAQKKFGTGSLLVDGNSDYLTVLDSDDWYFYDADFTIDFRVRFNATAGDPGFCGQYVDGQNYTRIYKGAANTLAFNGLFSNITKFAYTCAWTPATNTWYHVEIARSGATCYMFIDGDSKAVTEAVAFAASANLASVLYVGKMVDVDGSYYLNGWLDEFRISKGIARHTANFTPPTKAYSEVVGGGFSGGQPWIF